ncbi:hypothetical protein BDW59DRAFT_158153 [Aspergillus cavernicola]|uniref:Vacuolar ATPase assembly protein VMA22 n=1 Tax=Aspergillus cavernicola TaxID=176166 RepID=A0ABR4IVC4_9EURO
MPQLLTPPASRQRSETPDAELKGLHIADLTPGPLQSLDALLEQYLGLLDKHQKLHSELASKLSSGFLSLAHANYTCPPGRRYGADYYDERMKATRKVALQPPSSLGEKNYINELEESPQTGAPLKQTFSILSSTSSGEEAQPDTIDQTELFESNEKAAEQRLSNDDEEDHGFAESTANSEESSNPPKVEPEADTQLKPVKKKLRASDTIRWYGILVPASLRSAQRSFTEAVEGSLCELASVVIEMQATEKEISRLRRELGRKQ